MNDEFDTVYVNIAKPLEMDEGGTIEGQNRENIYYNWTNKPIFTSHYSNLTNEHIKKTTYGNILSLIDGIEIYKVDNMKAVYDYRNILRKYKRIDYGTEKGMFKFQEERTTKRVCQMFQENKFSVEQK